MNVLGRPREVRFDRPAGVFEVRVLSGPAMGLFETVLRWLGLGGHAPTTGPGAAGVRPARTVTSRRADLDPGLLAPLSPEQLAAEARALEPGARFFSWQRRIIPGADDPATRLMDRSMVSSGLVTPEELTEIHAIGSKMDQLRPHAGVAVASGFAAVQADRAQRARIKAQRRADSARRRREKTEAVAQRRANDIVYLGPGVSSALADRRSRVEDLGGQGLPILATPADLATAMGLTVKQLRWFSFHAVSAQQLHYSRFEVPKKSGGVRTLSSPRPRLKAAQRWVLDQILSRIELRDPAHGFVRGRSTVTGARLHVGSELLVQADLADYFPTITWIRVRGLFESVGYSPAVSTILALLCTECPRLTVTHEGRTLHVQAGPRVLPQGAPTSPALANLVSRTLDGRLGGLARKLGFTYTRYADDLTFSWKRSAAGPEEAVSSERKGTDDAPVGYLLAAMTHIVSEEGFRVNDKKTRVTRSSRRQTVTGVVVNDRVGAPRPLVRRLRAILHRARHEGLEAQNRDNLPDFRRHVEGLIAYVSMLNPAQAAPLQAALRQLKGSPS